MVYNLIKAEHGEVAEEDVWLKHIRASENFSVRLVLDPGTAALSEAELEILDAVADKFENIDQWELRDLTHEFPEWKNPGSSCTKIRPEEILRAVGKSEREIEEIARDTCELSKIDALLRDVATP